MSEYEMTPSLVVCFLSNVLINPN